jgi:hypothetical protein
MGLFSGASAFAEDAPTPEMIVNKYVKATGGADKWNAVKSRKQTGTLNIVAMGMSGSLSMAVEGQNAKQVMSLEGFGEFLSGIKDGTAWSSNMMQGDVILEGAEAEQALRQLDLAEWVNWKKHYASAETVGEEAVGDEACWKVVFTPENGEPQTYWFSKDTGLIVQSYGPGMGGPQTTMYKDYKDVNGLLIAHKMEMEGMNGPVEMTFDSVEINPDIDPSTFDVPDSIAALMK